MTVSIQQVEVARKRALRECKSASVLERVNALWHKSYQTEWFSNSEAAFIDAVSNGVYSNATRSNGRYAT